MGTSGRRRRRGGGRWLAGAAVTATCAALPLVAVVAVVGAVGGGAGGGGAGPGGAGPGGSEPQIPPAWLALDRAAAATCPGLPWSVLAAIGTVETDNGRSSLPGVASGANGAGAEGPMQFEPATFAAYALPVPSGGADPPSPYDLADATYAAARLLCADGGGDPATLAGAVFSYDHDTTYVDTVLTLALADGDDPSVSRRTTTVLVFAARQLGTPYRWGGEGPGGFDCSGLVQAAEEAAGTSLPRVAQDQFDAGPVLPAAQPPAPGDLVFFGAGPGAVEHVGLYVGGGEMIDAPHTGALVRFDPAAQPDGVGVTAPA